MKGLFTSCVAFALGFARCGLEAADVSTASQVAAEAERLRPQLESSLKGQPEGELEKAVQSRARGVVARRIFAEGVNTGDTNKLNEAENLDASVGKPAYFQSAAIKGLPPIYSAVEKGNPGVVIWLVERKSPVDFAIGMTAMEPDYQTYRAHIRQQPLQIAARNVQLEVMALLLNAGAKAETAGQGPVPGGGFGDTPLLSVLEPFRRYHQLPTNLTERLSAVRLLLQHGADPLLRQFINSTRSPLYPVFQSDLPELLDTLLTNSTTFPARTAEGCTTLHVAASSGRTNAVAALIAQGASVRGVPDQQFQPLQAAVFRIATPNDYTRLSAQTNLSSDNRALRDAVVEQLIAAGAQWDPFSAIVRRRTNELAALLKERPAAVRDLFLNQATPLHYAALHSQLWAIGLLLQHQAPLDAVDSVGHTPLHTALFHGRQDSVAMLLKAGAPVTAQDRDGNTPLHVAATRWGGAAAAAILARQPELNVTNRLGFTALDLAAQQGLTAMVALLTKAGAAVRLAGLGQTSLLHSAAEKGNLDLVRLALEQKLPVDARDQHGRTAFRCAIETGQVEAARLLLEAGADINARDTNGSTALHWRVRHGNDPVPDPMPAPGFSRLGAAARPREAALSAALPPALRPTSQSATLNPLIFLLESKADAAATNFAGLTPLHDLPQMGNYATDRMGYFTHHTAQTVDLLLRYGAKLETTDTNGSTPLHFAVQRGDLQQLFALLSAGANLEASDRQGQTALLLTSKPNFAEVTTYLLSAGANPTARDASGNTILHLLCSNHYGTLALPTNLVGHAKFHELVRLTNRFGSPPLHLALLKPSAPTLLLEGLLSAAPPLDFADLEGNTALHLAVARNHLPLAELLLARRADPNCTNLAGQTPLLLGYLTFLGHQFAPGAPFDPLGQLFLKHGARLDLADTNGRTPLRVAVADFRGVPASLRPPGAARDLFKALDEGDAASVKAWLLADPGLLRAQRHQHEGFPTFLHEAAQRQPKDFGPVIRAAVSQAEPFHALAFGWTDILRAVLRTNAGFAKEETQGRPAIHWAAGSGDVETVRVMLEAGADLRAVDPAGQTALPSARARQSREVMELLIARGLQPTVFDCLASDDLDDLTRLLRVDKVQAKARNRQGEPGLLVAAATGKLLLAEQLLVAGADANQGRRFEPAPGAPAVVVVRFAGGPDDRPLSAAVAVANLPMTELLLRHGADVREPLPSGFTLLHQAVAAGQHPLAKLLLEHGADANAQRLPEGEAQRGAMSSPLAGDTPLHLAARIGRTNLIHFLLQHGAKLEATNALGQTPLGTVLYPGLNAPAPGEIGNWIGGGVFFGRGLQPMTPTFPTARPTADFLRERGARRADPPAKGSWREALDPGKVHHPTGPLPAKGTPL